MAECDCNPADLPEMTIWSIKCGPYMKFESMIYSDEDGTHYKEYDEATDTCITRDYVPEDWINQLAVGPD